MQVCTQNCIGCSKNKHRNDEDKKNLINLQPDLSRKKKERAQINKIRNEMEIDRLLNLL